MPTPLAALLHGLRDARVVGDGTVAVEAVRDDSRQVGPGDVYVAVPGTRADGRAFIGDAVARGARVVVTDREADADGGAAGTREHAVTWVVVRDPRRALGIVAANMSGAAGALVLSAVTGTNGKTTTTHVIESILRAAGRRPGLIGTVAYRFGERHMTAPLTTPGALALHALFADMRRAGATDVVLEASSHALDQGRLHGCGFRVAALTNVTQDHLDYHRTMEDYFAAKAVLFRELVLPQAGVAVLRVDREDGRAMRREVRGGPVLGVSTTAGTGADVEVVARAPVEDGLRATLSTPAGPIEVASRLVGDYNLDNLALAAGVAVAHGIGPDAIARGIAELHGVPGRLERVPGPAGVLCLVDYAHTPDALERALGAVRPLARGRLIVVFGCGGDRDMGKRPLMGEAAGRLADVTVVTSDNPRSEAPRAIIDMVVPGLLGAGAPARDADRLAAGEGGFCVEPDRRAAIALAARIAHKGDVVLIAGKGHEDYQIHGTEKIHFDDREEAAAALAQHQRAAS